MQRSAPCLSRLLVFGSRFPPQGNSLPAKARRKPSVFTRTLSHFLRRIMQSFPKKKRTWVSSASQTRRWLAYRADQHGHHPHRVVLHPSSLALFPSLPTPLHGVLGCLAAACSWHFLPRAPLKQAPRFLFIDPAPLLKKEGHTCALALGLNGEHPFFLHRACAMPAFSTHNHPL